MISRYSHSHSWFTLVELIVGMTIFAIGLSGIYALLVSTMGNASYSRHEIVVANLLREQMELVKNIRDTNIRNFLPWNKLPQDMTGSGVFTIENGFLTGSIEMTHTGLITKSPVKLNDIYTPYISSTLESHRFDIARLYLDNRWRYTHVNTGTGTPYASYVIISILWYNDSAWNLVKVEKDGKPQWYIIDARVIVKSGNRYREYDAKTIVTDWIK
jgi:prepilin-type N-terminal cleavage/methylation domain-containing protein